MGQHSALKGRQHELLLTLSEVVSSTQEDTPLHPCQGKPRVHTPCPSARLGKGQHETSVSRRWWRDAHVFQQKMFLAENCKLPCVKGYELFLADLRHSWIELKEGLGKETIWKQD